MSDINPAIQELERELEASQQRCHLIERALEGLREIYGVTSNGDGPTKASRTNKQTNKQTKQAARRPAARSLPDDAGADILAQLRKHGGSMKPGVLAKAIGVSLPNLRYRTKPLIKAKAIVVSGATMNRLISLPGTKPAKEVP